jgi:hypothetical protein
MLQEFTGPLIHRYRAAELLESNAVLSSSACATPVADPLSLIQVDLLVANAPVKRLISRLRHRGDHERHRRGPAQYG